MSQNSLRPLRPLLIVFVLVTALFIIGRDTLSSWNADQEILLGGNLLVFITVLISYYLLSKAITSTNPNAFVRAMYGSFIIKFFLLALAAFIYIMVAGKNVNKAALFTCIGLYFVYTFIEISVLLKLLKQKKNA
jgi:hypothetical protein